MSIVYIQTIWVVFNCCWHVGLKKKKEQFESELEELGSIREMQLKESEASGRISGLEKKIQYAEIEKVTTLIIPRTSQCLGRWF